MFFAVASMLARDPDKAVVLIGGNRKPNFLRR
jgi:hypothetical protein